MNRIEKHLKKVAKAHNNIDFTMQGVAAQLADLKSHKADIAEQIIENNKLITELTSVNDKLDGTSRTLDTSIHELEKLLGTN